jgi:hypothetical protein
MTLLTSAECREIAERKIVEAEGDPVHGTDPGIIAPNFLRYGLR